MGWRVALTERARRDLNQVLGFIVDANPAAAARLGIELTDLIYSLDQMPRRGAPIPERRPYRKLVHTHYVVLYRLNDSAKRVEVARVLDGRRDPAGLKV